MPRKASPSGKNEWSARSPVSASAVPERCAWAWLLVRCGPAAEDRGDVWRCWAWLSLEIPSGQDLGIRLAPCECRRWSWQCRCRTVQQDSKGSSLLASQQRSSYPVCMEPLPTSCFAVSKGSWPDRDLPEALKDCRDTIKDRGWALTSGASLSASHRRWDQETCTNQSQSRSIAAWGPPEAAGLTAEACKPPRSPIPPQPPGHGWNAPEQALTWSCGWRRGGSTARHKVAGSWGHANPYAPSIASSIPHVWKPPPPPRLGTKTHITSCFYLKLRGTAGRQRCPAQRAGQPRTCWRACSGRWTAALWRRWWGWRAWHGCWAALHDAQKVSGPDLWACVTMR